MVTLLRRVFIRDYQNVKTEKVRTSHGIMAAWFGIVTNAILIGLKLSAAILMASQSNWLFSAALIGDSINNLGDVASSVVTLIGFHLARKPADEDHPYGHERIEYIAALIISMMILFAAVTLFYESLMKVIQGEISNYSLYSMIVLGVAVLLKLFQGYVNRGLGKAIDSAPLKATAIDSFADSIATTLILIGAVLCETLSWNWIDGYLGIGVSLFVGLSGVKAAKESIDLLIGKPTSREFVEEIKKEVMSHEKILGVHDIVCHSYGPHELFVTLHAELEGSLSLEEAHQIIDDIEEELSDRHHCHVVIHPDPMSKQTKAGKAELKKIEGILREIDPNMQIHDFHTEFAGDKKRYVFDVLAPFDCDSAKENGVLQALETAFPPNCAFSITFDHPYDK